MAGCGVVKTGGDQIGDGFLSEGGWDPFGGAPQAGAADGFADGEGRIGGSQAAGAPETDAAGGVASPSLVASGAAGALEDQFKDGDYRKALSAAEALRKSSAGGSADRDVATFIAGASQYYLGQFQAAQDLLDAHVKGFVKSRHRESSLYYQASNRVRLREWRVGAALLDNFIATYPDSLLFEFALFDRAQCHFGLAEYQDCLKLVDRHRREFLYSKIRDRALALRADVLRETGDLAGAEATYLQARDASRELEHADLEARCLARLTAVAAQRGEDQAAVGYYKAFFKDYADSQYATEAGVGGLAALEATGEIDAGLQNLERLLQDMPEKTDAGVMNDALIEYAKFYRQKHGPEMLMRQLGDLSSSPKGSGRLKEQLIVARLEALETYFPDRSAEIRVFYKEMRARFKPGDLSTTNAIKVADYIAEQQPLEAIAWYESALARGGSMHKARATLGLAKAQALCGEDAKAEAGFRKVLETFGSPELAEEATLGAARIAKKKADWGAAAYYWTSYLDHQQWGRSREEARLGQEEAKSHNAVAKAPPSSVVIPVKAVPDAQDPISTTLAKAQRLSDSGDKAAAFQSLDQLLTRISSADGLADEQKTTYRKAQILHEDLSMELRR